MLVWIGLLGYLIVIRLIIKDITSRENQRKYLILASIGITIVVSLRYPKYDVVYDLEGYYEFYKKIIATPWNEIFNISRFEYGYVILNKILATIIPWAQFIIFFEAGFTTFCFAYFIYKNSDEPFLGMYIYVTLGPMIFNLTAFRQAIAIGICLLSIEVIKKKSFWKFILTILIAISFHKTAIVFFPLYFIINREINKKNNIISIIFISISTMSAELATRIGNELLDMNYGGYIGNKYGGVIPIIIYILTIYIAFFNGKRIRNSIALNMVIVGLAIYSMRYATLALERISFFFTAGIVIALPEAINGEESSVVSYKLKLLLVYFSTVLFFYRLLTSEWAYYRFFWN